jgi:hypothetical protein
MATVSSTSGGHRVLRSKKKLRFSHDSDGSPSSTMQPLFGRPEATFLGLPLELRHMIYVYLFALKEGKINIRLYDEELCQRYSASANDEQ